MRYVIAVLTFITFLLLPLFALAQASQPASAPAGHAAWLEWLKANWWWIAVAVPAIITALSKYPKAKGVVAVIQAIFDFFSVLTHRDSPGTAKLPFTRSKPPKE